ncbi:MAG: LysM peptidoglycan-binding domain-containing protein, partial [Myxococcota bacterium]
MFRVILAVLLTTLVTPVAEGRGQSKTHKILQGETLWDISRTYGCSVGELKKANRLDKNLIRPGRKLVIPRCKKSRRSSSGGLALTHYVMEGESLSAIAKRYDTTVDRIRKRNGIKGTLIRPGQKLRVVPGRDGRGRAIPGQSVGRPANGRLVNGMQLP